MDYKGENKKTYNTFAREFDKKFMNFFNIYVKDKADNFLSELNGKKILDLGSGPGNHAAYFAEKGFDVLCLDISEKMLELCREKGLPTVLADIEDFSLPDKSFDGIWAYTSLLHVPKKKLPKVIKKLGDLLKPNGLLMVAVIKGDGEHFETRPQYPDTKRLFVYFRDEELRRLFQDNFSLINFSETKSENNKYVFLNYIFKPK